MNRLEKYAVRRIIFLSKVMDSKRNEISDALFLRSTQNVNEKDAQHANILFNHAHDEIKEICSCLTEESNDDLPF